MKKLFNALFAKLKAKPIFTQSVDDKQSGQSYSVITGPYCRTIIIPLPKKKA